MRSLPHRRNLSFQPRCGSATSTSESPASRRDAVSSSPETSRAQVRCHRSSSSWCIHLFSSPFPSFPSLLAVPLATWFYLGSDEDCFFFKKKEGNNFSLYIYKGVTGKYLQAGSLGHSRTTAFSVEDSWKMCGGVAAQISAVKSF